MNRLILALLLLTGCSSVKKESVLPRVLKIQPAWSRQTVNHDYLEFRIGHQMPAILLGDLVLHGNGIDGLKAFDKKLGRLRWQKKINGGVEIGAALSNNTLYFGANDGYFYAIDALTGLNKWSFPIRAEGLGRPTVNSGVVYFVSGNNTAYALKTETGEQLWFYTRPDNANLSIRGASQPTVYDNNVIIGFSDGALVALSKSKGSLVWEKYLGEQSRFKDIDAEPVLSGKQLFVPSYDGKLFCLNVTDGKVIWAVDFGGFQTPIIEGGFVYTSTSMGKVVALDRNSGKTIWEKSLSGTVATAPTYFKGLLFVGEWSGKFLALDASSGEIVSSYSTGRGVTSRPVVDEINNHVYVTGADGDLFALKFNWVRKGREWEWEKQTMLQ